MTALSCAVVGSGPAALGVITALLEREPQAQITLIERGESPAGLVDSPPGADELDAYYDTVYREIWSRQARTFPPPKTHFGRSLPKFAIAGKGRIFRSETFGGLSNYWGGTCLPFTDRELAGWPVKAAQLDPHYRRMADVVGIAGRSDSLSEYFPTEYINRPPLHITALNAAVERSVNAGATSGSGYRVVAGINRCAVETRPGHPRACVACGECLAGCARDSIFSSRQALTEAERRGQFTRMRARVTDFNPAVRTLNVNRDGQTASCGPFDRIYLAAGCPNTTAIVLQSLGLTRSVPMADNAVYVFPILYAGSGLPANDQRSLSLTNVILGMLPQRDDLAFAQAQIYPNFDYMWRYNLPPGAWSLFKPLVRWSRGRLLWGRLYMHGDLSQSYELSLRGGQPHFDYARHADVPAARSAFATLRTALNRKGFYVPPAPLIHQKSNTHYAGTLPYGGRDIDVNAGAEVAPGIHVCDASVFPSLPAVSLTFTIMANAHRIATESL